MVPKFRAYLKDQKYISPVISLSWAIASDQKESPLIEVINAETLKNDTYGFNEVELMQWTGLVDKNGVEIFQGDICRIPDRELLVVEWVKDMWHLKSNRLPNLTKGNYRLEYYLPNIEVIGNRYLNPELLEGDECEC